MTAAESPETKDAASRGWVAVVVLALLGAAAVLLLAAPAPSAKGLARIRSPAVLLSVFDTVWLLALLLPRGASWWDVLPRLAAPAPFHLAIAAAAGASAGFHAAWGLAAAATAAVGTLGMRVAPAAHGIGASAFCVALPLAAYAAGDFGGAEVRGPLAASPLVGPSLLAHASATASAADALPALAAAAVLLAADLLAGRRDRVTS